MPMTATTVGARKLRLSGYDQCRALPSRKGLPGVGILSSHYATGGAARCKHPVIGVTARPAQSGIETRIAAELLWIETRIAAELLQIETRIAAELPRIRSWRPLGRGASDAGAGRRRSAAAG